MQAGEKATLALMAQLKQKLNKVRREAPAVQ